MPSSIQNRRTRHLRKLTSRSSSIRNSESAPSRFEQLFGLGQWTTLGPFIEFFVVLGSYHPLGSETTMIVKDLRLIKQWGANNHAYISATVVLDHTSVHHLYIERISGNDTAPNTRVGTLANTKKGPLDGIITHLALPRGKDLYLQDLLAAVAVLHNDVEKYCLKSWKSFSFGGTVMMILASYLKCKITRTFQWCRRPGYQSFVPVIAPGEKEKIVAAVYTFMREKDAIRDRIDENRECLRQYFAQESSKLTP